MLYQKIIRPILFRFDPEFIHHLVIGYLGLISRFGPVFSLIKRYCFVSDQRLAVKLGTLQLKNPIGLAAGFDKNIDAPLAYPMLGFGFAELGSITYEPQPGNPKPRLWRLPKDRGLIVYYGLVNCGAKTANKKLGNKIKKKWIPYGLNIAPTTAVSADKMVADYIKSFLELNSRADYITLNVSCPNVESRDIFTRLAFIEELLEKIVQVRQSERFNGSIFVKISSEMAGADLDKIIELCLKFQITGLIVGNLLKDRSKLTNYKSTAKEMKHPGGVSGGLLKEKNTETIKYIYQKAGEKLQIIGLGGVFTAQDVYDKIRAGASAVQLITGFIYGGPLVVRKINKELISLLKQDGYDNIQAAVGADVTLNN